MAYLFNKVFSDDFARPNENPLNAANWVNNTIGAPFTNLQIVNNKCVSDVTNSGGLEFYTGAGLGNDQYVTATIGSAIPGTELDLYLRSDLATATNYYTGSFFINPGGDAILFLLKFGGQIGSNIPISGVKPGDTMTVGIVGTTIFLLYNGVQMFSGTDASFSSGHAGMGMFPVSNREDIQVSYYETGNLILQSAYSVPDRRRYGQFPNKAELNEGTYLYDVQTSSNSAVPSKDSRAAGAPTDSRASKPTNSRTPGTFGPGNN